MLRACTSTINTTYVTLLELQARFGDKPFKFQVICPQLSPKRDCGPERVKGGRTMYLVTIDAVHENNKVFHAGAKSGIHLTLTTVDLSSRSPNYVCRSC